MERMRALRTSYMATLATDIEEMRTLLTQSEMSGEDILRIRFLTHKIGGSAIVFDLSSLGEKALAAEATVLEAAVVPRTLLPAERMALEEAFADFLAEFRASTSLL